MHEEKLERIKSLILEDALKIVPTQGWNKRLLNSLAEKHKIDQNTLSILFPQGISSLIRYFSEDADQRMIDEFNTLKKSKLDSDEIIQELIRIRFTQNIQNRECVRRVINYDLFHPIQALNRMYPTVDIYLTFAGDKSGGVQSFTKRIFLMMVYCFIVYHWAYDTSENFEGTWQYVDKKINLIYVFGIISKNDSS